MVILGAIEHDSTALKGHGVGWVLQVTLAKLVGDHAGLHDGRIKQIAFHVEESGFFLHRLLERLDDVRVGGEVAFAVVGQRLAIGGEGGFDLAVLDQFGHHRGHTPGAIKVFAQVFASRLQIDQEWQVVANFFPVVVVQLHANVSRNGIDVDGRVRGSPDG